MVTVMFSDLDSSPGLCLILHNIVCFLFIRKKMLTWYFREEKFTDVTDWIQLPNMLKMGSGTHRGFAYLFGKQNQ